MVCGSRARMPSTTNYKPKTTNHSISVNSVASRSFGSDHGGIFETMAVGMDETLHA
jgi:hypothetical protein